MSTYSLPELDDVTFSTAKQSKKSGRWFLDVKDRTTGSKLTITLPFMRVPYDPRKYADPTKSTLPLTLSIDNTKVLEWLEELQNAALPVIAKQSKKVWGFERSVDELKMNGFFPIVKKNPDSDYPPTMTVKIGEDTDVYKALNEKEISEDMGTLDDAVQHARISVNAEVSWIYFMTNSHKKFGFTLQAKAIGVLPPTNLNDSASDDKGKSNPFGLTVRKKRKAVSTSASGSGSGSSSRSRSARTEHDEADGHGVHKKSRTDSTAAGVEEKLSDADSSKLRIDVGADADEYP